MTDHYIIDELGIAHPEPDLLTWAKWFETHERHIACVIVNGVRVSTVFLGLNHNFGAGEPIPFETMIFGGPHDQYQERYATHTEALIGHAKAVNFVKSAATTEGQTSG